MLLGGQPMAVSRSAGTVDYCELDWHDPAIGMQCCMFPLCFQQCNSSSASLLNHQNRQQQW